MIDLRKNNLPKSLVVNGEAFAIKTDFRVWIAWQHELETKKKAMFFIFSDKVPLGNSWISEAVKFMQSPNSTPKARNGSVARAYDFVEDGEYIVASFQQAYGIDLTDPDLEMHWHRFKALFTGLPSDTKMAQIIGYRTYEKSESKKKPETVYASLRDAWRLPRLDQEDIVEMQYRMFGSLLKGGENGRRENRN